MIAAFLAVAIASSGVPPCVGVYVAPDAIGSHVDGVETDGCGRAVEDHGRGSHVSGVRGGQAITVRGRGNIVEGNITVDACPPGSPTRALRDAHGNVHVICRTPRREGAR